MTTLVTNNAFGVLLTTITSISSTISVQSGQGSRFPSPGVGEQAFLTLIAPATGIMEIVKYTSRSGDTFSGLTRGSDGTTATGFTAGDTVELRVVAATYTLDGIAPNQTGQDGKFIKSVGGVAQWQSITSGDVSGLGTLATQSGTFSGTHSGNSSGTNTGDQNITLTGDVTGAGTTSFAATISGNAVTLAKMAQVASSTFLGRSTAGTGNVEAMTPAQAKAALGITGSDVSGLALIAASGSAGHLVAGIVPDARMPALTGDVTTTAGAVATTISANAVTTTKILNNAVTMAKIEQLPTLRLLGRVTAGNGAVEILTGSQVKPMLAIAQADVAGLTTASAPTFAGVTLTGGAVFKDTAFFDSVGAAVPGMYFTRNGVARWLLVPYGAESSGNAGSNLALYSYADNGAFLFNPVAFDRATNTVSLSGTFSVGGSGYVAGDWTVNNNFNVTALSTLSGGVNTTNISATGVLAAKAHNQNQYTLTTSGAITLDYNNGQSQIITLNAATSIAAINNVPVGSILRVVFIGNFNPSSWPAAVKWVGGTAPNLTAGALDRAIVVFTNDGTYLLASTGAY